LVEQDYRLRPCTEADHDFCWELRIDSYRAYVERLWGWDEAWQRARFEKSMKDNTIHRRLIERDGEAIGLLELTHEEAVTNIKNIQVMSTSQGAGIGTQVMRGLMADAREAGRDVTLQVFMINPRAWALYERLGFKETGRSATHVHMRWVCPTDQQD
jgi:ribosomal protein S18 acetylase RimI-like enzyme